MKTLHPISILALSILLVSLPSGLARASLSWEFGFIGDDNNFSGSGSFTLDGPDGSSGSVTAYEYSGVCGLDAEGMDVLCDFGLSDITFSDWSLRPDWSFELLTIFAVTTPRLDGIFSRVDTRTGFLSSRCVEDVVPLRSCRWFPPSLRLAIYSDGAFLSPIHDVPEPHTFGLFMIGLLALAAAGSLPPRRRIGSGRQSGG